MAKKKYSEKYLEKKLREEVKTIGGLALKFQSPSFTGMPDRLLLMPNGKSYWAEIKTTGKKCTKEQVARGLKLTDLGFKVFVIDDMDSLNRCIKTLCYDHSVWKVATDGI